MRPEVSSLDFTNAVIISGFRIPALRTRRIATTVDVRRDQSLIISGLFDDERRASADGHSASVMDIPILGALFGSSSWQIEPDRAAGRRDADDRRSDVTRRHGRAAAFVPDTALPAREAIEKRLPPPPIKP